MRPELGGYEGAGLREAGGGAGLSAWTMGSRVISLLLAASFVPLL